jgi:Flp pilus assembly protein TadD
MREWTASWRLLMLALVPLASAAPAQDSETGTALAPAIASPPLSGELGGYLRTLARQPRDLNALLGAGRLALESGDIGAAFNFYSRADEVSPHSGPAKAGLGSALVMSEKSDDALRLFAEAVSLGVPEYRLARDRGLAYDLRGDNRRAQRDYQLAYRNGPDDELTRRYALSLGISGSRDDALTLLDPLLRRKDQAAWRARALVLALNGDVRGANGIARAVMARDQADSMVPFLRRLASLNPADKAHAVNFGTIPSDGTQVAAVQIGDPYRSGGASGNLIPAGDPFGRRDAAETNTRVAAVARASNRFKSRSIQPRYLSCLAYRFSRNPQHQLLHLDFQLTERLRARV